MESDACLQELHALLERIRLTARGLNPNDDKGYIFTRRGFLLDDIERALICLRKLDSGANESMNSREIFVSPDGGERTDGR